MRQVLKRGSGEDDVSTRGLDATGTSNRDLYDSYRCLYDTCSAYSTIDDCMKYMAELVCVIYFDSLLAIFILFVYTIVTLWWTIARTIDC